MAEDLTENNINNPGDTGNTNNVDPASEFHANVYIETTISNSKHLNRSILKKQKYNLINEIKQNYDLATFFGSKPSNYKVLASIYTLMESNNTTSPDNKQLINNKINLLEHLTKKDQIY